MTWIKSLPPKMMNDTFAIYADSTWFKEMDRCWVREEDGVMVSSRLIRVPEEFGGKVEHVTITCGSRRTGQIITYEGEGDLSWQEKQQIKDELFGENRVAIEIFPKANRLIDTADVYHLWVFDKKFNLPFGIHPKELTKAVNRGYNMTQDELEKLQNYYKDF